MTIPVAEDFIFVPFFMSGQQTINGNLTHDNISRSYILYVPASYNSASPVPLVFCFHGYTSNSNANFSYTNFKSIADTAGFIVVHPQGTLDNNGSAHWNVGGWTVGSTVDDVGFTSALLDSISPQIWNPEYFKPLLKPPAPENKSIVFKVLNSILDSIYYQLRIMYFL